MRHLLNGQRYMVSVVGHLAFMALGGEERGRKEGRKEAGARKEEEGNEAELFSFACRTYTVDRERERERERERRFHGGDGGLFEINAGTR